MRSVTPKREWLSWVVLAGLIAAAIGLRILIPLLLSVESSSLSGTSESIDRREHLMVAQLQLASLDEGKGTVRASLAFDVTDQALRQHVMKPGTSVLLWIVGGSGENLVWENLVFIEEAGAVGSEAVSFEIPFLSDSVLFPFDSFVARVPIYLNMTPGLESNQTGGWPYTFVPKFSIVVNKSFSGYVLNVSGQMPHLDIELTRPVSDKVMFGIATFVLLTVVCAVAVAAVISEPQTALFQLLVATAGLALAAAGFRSIAVPPDLPSRSLFDIVVFMPSLLFLGLLTAGAGLRLAWTRWYARRR